MNPVHRSERERKREGKREGGRVSRKCWRALSVPQSISQSIRMRDYYINETKIKLFFIFFSGCIRFRQRPRHELDAHHSGLNFYKTFFSLLPMLWVNKLECFRPGKPTWPRLVFASKGKDAKTPSITTYSITINKMRHSAY